MKKIILFSFIIYPLSLILTLNSYAVSPTPTATTTAEQQIDQLKDRIASRVAQLNLVEKRGIIGVVTDVTGTQITLTDIKGDTRFIDVDELTKFTGGPSDPDSFGISDVKKDSTLGVLGLYNKQSRRILARTIDVITVPKILHGNIATIDTNNYILNIATSNSEQLQIEVETTTKSFSFDKKTENLVNSGFSKIVEGETIFVIGYHDKQDNSKLIASRIILFPDFIKKPSIEISPTIVPSTGSGKKLTPIVK